MERLKTGNQFGMFDFAERQLVVRTLSRAMVLKKLKKLWLTTKREYLR